MLIVIQNVSFTYDTRIKNVAASLERSGYEVLIVSPRYPADPLRTRSGNVESWHYPFPAAFDGTCGHLIEYLYSLCAIGVYSIVGLIKWRARIVHVCSPPDILFPLAALYRGIGCKLIVDVHDLSPELAVVRYGLKSDSLVVRFLRFAESAMLYLSTQTITTTDSQRKVLSERSGLARSRICVVRNGIDPDVMTAVEAMQRSECRTVGYLGTMNPQDGIDILLRAIGHIRYSLDRRDIRFLLVGDGSAFDSLRALASELNIDEVVSFTGRLRPADALGRMSECDVCVQPDPRNEFTDTCCMVKSLEYMSLGKPIVAFGLRETQASCGSAAIYARNDSHVELAEQIVGLIDDPAKQVELGEEGRRRVSESFLWQNSERELLKVYRGVSARIEDVEDGAVEAGRYWSLGGTQKRRHDVDQRGVPHDVSACDTGAADD